MDLAYGLPVLAALGYSLYVVHHVATRERRKAYLLRRAAGGSKPIRLRKRRPSPRSEMRACEDPTTMMEAIKTRTSPPE